MINVNTSTRNFFCKKMPITWISINKKLLEGTALINLLPTTKFTLLLRRINESEDVSDPFTKEELKKLGQIFQLKDDDTLLLTQCLIHIWNQSTKVILKPTDLQKNLVEDLKLDNEKVDEFIKLWTERIKVECGDLDKKKKLEAISWQINLQAASKYKPKEVTPKVRLQLKLSDFVNEGDIENVTLDIGEEEIVRLYNVVENAQAKLDSIFALSE